MNKIRKKLKPLFGAITIHHHICHNQISRQCTFLITPERTLKGPALAKGPFWLPKYFLSELLLFSLRIMSMLGQWYFLSFVSTKS